MRLLNRFHHWWQSRLPVKDSTVLTQRNVYIVPTWPGVMLALTILVLLISSINYQLNLGYLLTFLLTGCAVVGMHVSHGTLRGLGMHLTPPESQFAGSSVQIPIHIANTSRKVRFGIGLAILRSEQWNWTDVPAQGTSRVSIAFTADKRGLHSLPPLTAETRYPLGTFRVWTVWRPAAKVLIYPQPETNPPPLPPGEPRSGGAATTQRHSTGEFDGVRAYRRGDPLKMVVWKKVAKADELVSRDAQQAQRLELWLDWTYAKQSIDKTGAALNERTLSRLCAWVLLAEKQGLQYGLRLPLLEIAPDHGAAHQKNCLQALALV
jgi:uncharacterized protein (DUF58 family)